MIRVVKTPAKINLGLNIVSKRNDGYHNLETIFYPIEDLFDELIFEESSIFKFQNDYNFDNIIVRAVKLLELHSKRKFNIKIILKKNIPIGAGLGGGSSDAAIVIKTINDLFKLELSIESQNTLALELGSDVPFFINPIPSIGKSRGENLTPINLKLDIPILIVNPGINISTRDAFDNITPKSSLYDYKNIKELNFTDYKNYLINDFEYPIFDFFPEIRKIKELMISKGSIFSLMSGTGSTVYGLFNTIEEAKNCASLFPKDYFIFISNPQGE